MKSLKHTLVVATFCCLPHFVFAEFCAVPQKKAQIVSTEAVKNKYDVYPGEAFTVLDDDRARRRVKIQVGEGEFMVRSRDVKLVERPTCEPDLCIMLSAANTYNIAPNSSQAMSGMSGIFKIVSRYKNWYRFKSDYGFGWIKSTQLKRLKVSCSGEADEIEDLLEVEVKKIPSARHEGWKFGVEGGYYPMNRSDAMIDALTPIPAGGTPVNNDTFDSPFIQEVNDRFGFFIGGNLETPLFWILRHQISVGYKYRVIEYISRPNPPSGGSVTFDQLQREAVDMDFHFGYVTWNPKLRGWDILGLRWQPGVQVVADVLINAQSIDFGTAPNKTNLRTKGVGYEAVEIYFGPRLDIKYRSLVFAVAANFHPDYDFEPELRGGFQF